MYTVPETSEIKYTDRLHQYLERLAADSRAHDGLAIQKNLKAVILEYTRSGFDTWDESGVG